MAKKKAKPRKQAKVTSVQAPTAGRDLDFAVQVWEHYPKLRSARAVAAKIKACPQRVRELLHADAERMMAMIDVHQEALAADWEGKHERVQGGLGRLLALFEGMLLEIETAAKENRITTIQDKTGMPLPVLDAVQYVVMTRLMDQMMNLAIKGQAMATAYRKNDPRVLGAAAGGGVAGGKNPEDAGVYDESALIEQVMKAEHLKLPPILAKKIELLRKQRAETKK